MASKLLDIYLGSKELKALVVTRSKELQIPFRYICHEVGIGYPDFMGQYINSANTNLKISEDQFEKILTFLGISVRFQFIVSKGYRGIEARCWLKEKYDSHMEGKNGKRQDTQEEANYPAFDT